jgi:hypothetical protein
VKIDKIISSINENHLYTSFLPIFYESWRKITDADLEIAFITNLDYEDDYIKCLSKIFNLHIFHPIKGVDIGVQTKVTRMILASGFDKNVCLLSDIDMIPLSDSFIKIFESIPEDHFVKFGYDHKAYSKDTSDYGKFPMDKTVCRGDVLKEIINPRKLLYTDLIKSWFKRRIFDDKESLNNKFENFSDESLLRSLHEEWKFKDTRTSLVARSLLEKSYMSGRIDRSSIHNIVNTLNTAFECHGKRPFDIEEDFYKIIIHYLDIDPSLLVLNNFLEKCKEE